MVDVSYEDYQDLVRKLSLANERVRDLQERVSGRDAHIAALEAQLAEARKALAALDRMSRGVDWCDQDEQARRWSAARRVLEAQGGE